MLRRSSTTRNIGNGQTTTTDDDDDRSTDFRRVNSVGYLDDEALKRKAEIDQHVASYVADQLERMRSNDSTSVNGVQDELEAQLDGANDWERTSEWEVQSP
jgi:hypothetical protein